MVERKIVDLLARVQFPASPPILVPEEDYRAMVSAMIRAIQLIFDQNADTVGRVEGQAGQVLSDLVDSLDRVDGDLGHEVYEEVVEGYRD